MDKPTCPYCGESAKITSGATLYPHLPEFHRRNYWACLPCNAYVGCHPHSTRPMGTLADSKLRLLRMATHRAFDPLWKSGEMERPAAYAWLAERMKIRVEDCHIAQFDTEQCETAIEILRKERKRGTIPALSST
jgi:hypothetical protein